MQHTFDTFSTEPIHQIFVKYLSLLRKKMGKNIGKSVRKNLSSKNSEKMFDYAEESAALRATNSTKDEPKSLHIYIYICI